MSYVLDGTAYLTGVIVAPQNLGTVSLWVKRTASSGSGAFFDTDPARHQLVLTDTAATGHMDGENFAFATGELAGSWQHVMVSYSKTAGCVFYLAGAAGIADTTVADWGATAASTQITIGARYTQASSFLTGRIAEFALYDAVLTEANAASLAGGASPQSVAGANLVHYHRLNAALTPTVGGVTLTTGGATADGADNPTVAAYATTAIRSDVTKSRHRQQGGGGSVIV